MQKRIEISKPMPPLRFSIIVPVFNEEKDIRQTLNNLETLTYPDYEVVVVDDGSTDKTVSIVQSFTNRLKHFRLFRQPENRGVSSARNRGVREAAGEIIVLLNADALLPKDFLNQIKVYYENEKHWVAVLSQVCNYNSAFARYIAAEEYYTYFVENRHWVWSEGFSCTKQAAIEVGLFPEAMPGCSGEDGFFGLALERKYPGFRTKNIIVPHVAPEKLTAFWNQQTWRGKGRTNHYYYVQGYKLLPLFISCFLSSISRIFKIILLHPALRAWTFSKYSPRKKSDFFGFMAVSYIKEIAITLGIWSGFFTILQSKLKNKKLAGKSCA